MWAGFGFAEKLGAADATKTPMHLAAAICDALKIGEFAFDGYRVGWKASIDGSATGSEVLAETTPTDSCHDRYGSDLIANGSAQTPSSVQHWISFELAWKC
jgi:hypothetical protein